MFLSRLFSKQPGGKVAFICALLIWIASGPFYFWNAVKFLGIAYKIILFVVIGFIFMRNRSPIYYREAILPILFFLSLLLYSCLPLLNGNSNIFGFISSLFAFFLFYIAFSNKFFIKNVFDIFSFLYAITVGISLISWVLMLLGVTPLLGIIDNITFDRYYYHYPFLIVEQHDHVLIEESIRFAGHYDEPGLIGTFSAFILYINRFNLKKPVNILCLISGICSLSFFFAIVCLAYFVISFLFQNGAKFKKRNNTIKIVFVILGLSVFTLYQFTKDNDLIYGTFWSRFEYNKEEGKLSGVNRTTSEADKFYDNLTLDAFLFGGDAEQYKTVVGGSSSYKSVVVNNGAVFLLIYLLFFFLYARKRCSLRSNLFFFLFFLLGNTYQRPDIYGLAVFFLYICLANDISEEGKIMTASHTQTSKNI